jgi:hypothetical protein
MPTDDPNCVASMRREVRSVPLDFGKCYERFFKRDSRGAQKMESRRGLTRRLPCVSGRVGGLGRTTAALAEICLSLPGAVTALGAVRALLSRVAASALAASGSVAAIAPLHPLRPLLHAGARTEGAREHRKTLLLGVIQA